MKKIILLIIIISLNYFDIKANQKQDSKLLVYLKKAFVADSLKQYDKELEILNNTINEFPNSDSAYSRRSRVKVILNDMDGAIN